MMCSIQAPAPEFVRYTAIDDGPTPPEAEFVAALSSRSVERTAAIEEEPRLFLLKMIAATLSRP
jgi:hypothetical protein